MSVLVTGADGFMGSHLTEALLDMGADVTVLIRGTSMKGTSQVRFNRFPQKRITELRRVICCDVASPDATKLVIECHPDVIFHLAAIAYVPFSFEHPIETANVNVGGTLNMLEAARQLPNLRRIVCTSSSEIFGTALTDRIDETHPLNPTSPYGASKAAADRFAYSYWNTYGIPVAIIRPFNTYGPRHVYDVVPKFIDLALKEKDITIYGDGKQSRDLTYVADMVRAFLIMGFNDSAVGKTVNFGTGIDHSVLDIAKEIVRQTGSKSRIVHTPPRKAEVQRLTCDPSLAMDLFGWMPVYDLKMGLEANIYYARENL